MLDLFNISNYAQIHKDYENTNSIQKTNKNMKKILLIATYDSFLRSGLAVAKTIENAKIEIRIRTSVDNQLSTQQLKSILKDEDLPYSSFFLNNYKDINYNQYDIIIISAGNGFNKSFFEFYLSNKRIDHKKILTITLFPGVISGDIDSITARIHGDVLLCNNKMDYNIAYKIKRLWSLPTQVFHYGFPVIQKINTKKKESIYFFEQVKIPETYIDRMYLLTKLIEFAFSNPSETIYIKPRVSLSERTIHPNKYPMEKLIETYKKSNPVPPNLFFTYDDINLCLSKSKMVITLSSTVAFEAIYNDLPTIIISDFGLKKSFANQYFIESGCMVNFSEINKTILSLNKNWYNQMVDFPEDRDIILNKYINMYFTIDSEKVIPTSLNTKASEYIEYTKENKIPTTGIIQLLKRVKTVYKFVLNYRQKNH